METNNKIIAEFMGLKVITKEEYLNHPKHETLSVQEYSILEYQRYHSDWNWLMQVVEKIESLSFNCEISTDSCTIHSCLGREVFETYAESKIEAVYNACIEFIKWYNENKN